MYLYGCKKNVFLFRIHKIFVIRNLKIMQATEAKMSKNATAKMRIKEISFVLHKQ